MMCGVDPTNTKGALKTHWGHATVLEWVRKFNLLRRERSAELFKALKSRRAWGAASVAMTDQFAALPCLTKSKQPQLMAVLLAQLDADVAVGSETARDLSADRIGLPAPEPGDAVPGPGLSVLRLGEEVGGFASVPVLAGVNVPTLT